MYNLASSKQTIMPLKVGVSRSKWVYDINKFSRVFMYVLAQNGADAMLFLWERYCMLAENCHVIYIFRYCKQVCYICSTRLKYADIFHVTWYAYMS